MADEEVLVLTRIAQRYPQYRDVLLPIIETVLTNTNGAAGSISGSTERRTGTTFPVEIFKVYQGERHVAFLHDTGAVELDGTTYYSPSAAATSVTDYPVNGWRWWRYRDPDSGQIHEINDLRSLVG